MSVKCNITFLNRHNTESNVFKRHSHNCYEIVYFLKGEGRTEIGNQSYEITPNSFVLIPPDTEHVECITGYGEILFIGFDFVCEFFDLKQGVYFTGGKNICLDFFKIFEEYKNQSFGFLAAANSLLELIIINLMRDTLDVGKKCKNLDHIKNYIEQHTDQKINFKELAAVSGYSEDYFRHIFKQRFGVSPQKYMINVRLEKACNMLLETELTCTEIAYECGFSNSAQFSAMFKERYKFAPKDFKNNRLI